MNIICNNCVGARIYQYYKTEYKNPFIWSALQSADFCYLVENYNTINYNNIKLKSFSDKIFFVEIDNYIFSLYPHYVYDENEKTPVKKSQENKIDIYYNDIENYILEKYNSRLSRMVEPPVFLFVQKPILNVNVIYNNSDLEIFGRIKTPYQKIIYTSETTSLNTKDFVNTTILTTSQDISQISTIDIAKDICKKINFSLD